MKHYLKVGFSLVVVLLFFYDLSAQNNRYYYEYEVGDQVDKVSFHTPAEIEFVEWESNNFLFEYFVQVSNIPKIMYNSLLKTPRYKLQKEMKGRDLKVYVESGSFRIFSSTSGQVEESIKLTVYYPKEFRNQSEELLRK